VEFKKMKKIKKKNQKTYRLKNEAFIFF